MTAVIISKNYILSVVIIIHIISVIQFVGYNIAKLNSEIQELNAIKVMMFS